MKSRFLLDVVIAQGSTIFQLLSSKDETLLIWWDPFLVLDLSFDVVNGIGRFDVQRDGFTGECFYENLLVQFIIATVQYGTSVKGKREG